MNPALTSAFSPADLASKQQTARHCNSSSSSSSRRRRPHRRTCRRRTLWRLISPPLLRAICLGISQVLSDLDIFAVVGAHKLYDVTFEGDGCFRKICRFFTVPTEPEKMARTPIVEQVKEEQIAELPSFSQLIVDLSKLALEGMRSIFLYLIPSHVRRAGSRKNLTLLKDSLKMPED
ncbi:hypothetical protein Droror1_Dr00008172 [Drosera rotundifolia]